MDKITKSVVGKGEPTPDPAPMTDKTMREIKFRVYNKTQAKMSAPFTLIDLMCVEVPLLSGSVMTDEIEWLQCAGLKDKNGVEIYEGDVVKLWGKIAGRLEWMLSIQTTVTWSPTGLNWNVWAPASDERWEVIGNIYGNPELLET